MRVKNPPIRSAAVLLSILLSLPTACAGTVIVLGDSISAGYGLRAGTVWVGLLEETLGASHRVINASISGDTSQSGLNRLPKLLEENPADVVIVELGGNDALRGLPMQMLQENLIKMVGDIIRSGAKPVLMQVPLPANYGRRYQRLFAEQFQAAQQVCGCPLIRIEDIISVEQASAGGYLQDDGIHPTESAQPLLMRAVLDHIAPLL
ncbi:MAG: arylesterase [Gammaproteobacteria bacterium AqS3]|nr:arylesterase [Gammaproteobacteria bacterium AqS3]